MRVRAPATAANLGPGFDVAGVAFDLWNEVEVGEGNGRVDEDNLVVQAFARFASPRGRSFTFVERIPRERGLGSSASAVALGLVAGALAAGVDPTADELLEAGLDLEGHPDNLAAALAGGVCLTWEGHIARVADDLPAGALGAALSGSGPTVLVWAERTREADVVRELTTRFPDHEVCTLSVTSIGAGPL